MKTKVCRVVPTPTGWTWAPDNRPWAAEQSECQCVFAVALDRTVTNHSLAWTGSMGRPAETLPDRVTLAILHLDREAGTDADIDVLTVWSGFVLAVDIVPVGKLPDDVRFPGPGLEDRLYAIRSGGRV